MVDNRRWTARIAGLVRTVVVGAAVAAAAAAQGVAHAQPFLPAPPSVLKQPQIDLGSAIAMPDVIYARIPGFRPLKMDIYKPKGAGKPVPVMLFMHGGGWQNSDPRGGPFTGADSPAVFADLAGHGYVIASIAYRFSGEARFPAQIQDVRAAIRFLRTHAAEYGADPAQVFISGASAGGYLAVMAGVSCGDASLEAPLGPNAKPPAAGSECVKGVVAFYPATDFVDLAHFPVEAGPTNDSAEGGPGKLLGCAPLQCPAAIMHRASILERISANDPPFLIFHGDSDKVVPTHESVNLNAALKAKGVQSELVIVPGASHAFPQLNADGRRKIIDKVEQFLDQHSTH